MVDYGAVHVPLCNFAISQMEAAASLTPPDNVKTYRRPAPKFLRRYAVATAIPTQIHVSLRSQEYRSELQENAPRINDRMKPITVAEEVALSKVIRRAGATLLEFWPGGASLERRRELATETKADGSFVTQADFSSNEILLCGLRDLFPSDGILSEEVPPSPELPATNRLWIVDPLDGTQSFVNGNDDFSVLVALCVGKHPEYGAMFFPAREQFAYAQRGAGAYLNGNRLAVSKTKQLRPRSVYLRHLEIAQKELAYDQWLDSGCAFLSLSRGEFDGIIIKIVCHREWDLAAPAIVIEESGGKVSDEHGKRIAFNEGAMNYKYFVASNGAVHDDLLTMISGEV